MGFFSKIKGKNKDKIIIVFDFGSSSVGGAIFLMQDSGNPKIIFSIRESIVVENELKVENFLNHTLKALRIVVEKVAAQGTGSPFKIFCVLSSPWFHSETRIVKLKKDAPFTFDTKLADELTKKEVSFLMDDYFSKNKDHIGKIAPIEMKTMSVFLNGYEVSDPYNKKVTDLEMYIFVSMSEEGFIDKVEETIRQYFYFEKIKYSSFLMASFAVARGVFVNKDKFLLINIGGEVTDISMIKKSVIKDSISFPMGSNFITRGLSKELKLSLEEVKSLIYAYKDNHISPKSNVNFNKAIEVLKNDWLKVFQESLNNLSHDISIPSTIFITVDQDLALFFSEIIKNEQLSQYTLTESKFRIIFLGVDSLHGIVTFKGDIKKRDPLLVIDAIYINHFLK